MLQNPHVELVVDLPCLLGENPLWHPEEAALYWTDIPAGRLYRYHPATGNVDTIYQGAMVGGFTIQADGSLLLFSEQCAVYQLSGGKLQTVLEPLPNAEEIIFNDVIADPLGGVFCGTKYIDIEPGKTGDLYYLNPKGQLTHLMTDVKCSNGFAFTRDLQTLYFTDTWAKKIYQFSYDQHSGAIDNRRVFIENKVEAENLDGMTVDSEGYVWSAIWGGSCLVRFTPDGEEVARITFPAVRITSLTFGGSNYEDIYVTSAGGDDRQSLGTGAGALFRVRTGVKGKPEFRSRIKA